MTLSDLLTTVRDLLAEPDSSGRFSDNELTRFINEGQNKLALAIRWPEGVLLGATTANIQEYTLPEDCLAPKRVYLNGQQLAPTTLGYLEGIQMNEYDQTGTNNLPEWITLDQAPYSNPTTYPVQTGTLGAPFWQEIGAPGRPAYYLRGANLGIIPVPSAVYQLNIACIIRPFQFSPSQQAGVCIFPEIARYTIAHKAAQLAKESDRKYDEATQNEQSFLKDLPTLITWKRQMQSGLHVGPVIRPYRQYYQGMYRGSR